MSKKISLITDKELIELSKTEKHSEFVFDVECYSNYFLAAFKSIHLEKYVFFEIFESGSSKITKLKLKWMFDNFCTIGFNSNNYDVYICAMAISGCSTKIMQNASTKIIEGGHIGPKLLKDLKIQNPLKNINHIDLINVAPLSASLKIYGGRMHSKKLQDLPFTPGIALSIEEQQIIKNYCVNDLETTLDLYNSLSKELKIRKQMGLQYKSNFLSKSDSQIAEMFIIMEAKKHKLLVERSPKISSDVAFKYKPPAFIKYEMAQLQNILDVVENLSFYLTQSGAIRLPEVLKKNPIRINKTIYRMGIGGIHSQEKSISHIASQDVTIKDIDVTSYYPHIILNLKLYPKHIGPIFLTIFQELVAKRVAAKKANNKIVSDTLKIIINSLFGKFGSVFSRLYSPDLLLAVALTGQLCLLLLIERLEMRGIEVVSANTDGIVIKYEKTNESLVKEIVKKWEVDANFKTEEVTYRAIYYRDVNNYIALKNNGGHGEDIDAQIKTKGIFSAPGLSKNPQNEICIYAIKQFLVSGIPIPITIRGCSDIRKFVNVRTVKGGAVETNAISGETRPIGKAIRWYYSTNSFAKIQYANNGNMVPRAFGVTVLMELPDIFPDDVDAEWYIQEANSIFEQISHTKESNEFYF